MAEETGIGTLVGEKVLVGQKTVKDLLIERGFGEKKLFELVLDLIEAAYLVDKEKIVVKSNGKELTKEELLSHAEKKDKKFYEKYIVYSDLRERGYVVKTGYKFGFDLRVYPRGKKPGEKHTQWVVNVSSQNKKYSFTELSRMVRLSGNIKTTVLQAVVDSEDDVNYYEMKRLTP